MHLIECIKRMLITPYKKLIIPFGDKRFIFSFQYKRLANCPKKIPPNFSNDIIEIIDKRENKSTVCLSVCAIFKNEPDLKEWLEYHKLVGVERFYLYDNDSDYAVNEILQPYIDEGSVIYHKVVGKCMQLPVYADAIQRYKDETRWLAFIDIDEFIVPVEKNDIKDVISDFKEYPALVANWVMFDSNGLVRRPNRLVTEAYTRCESNDNFNYKSIVNPQEVAFVKNPHMCVYKGKRYAADENFKDVEGTFTKKHSEQKIRINHYHTKSYEDYMIKRIMGYADQNNPRPEIDPQIYAKEYKHDYVIQKYLPELKKRMNIID